MAVVYFWVADWNLNRDEAIAKLGIPASQVEDMVDTVHADVGRLPRSLRKVAGYTTGTPDIQWTAGDWQRFNHASKIRIDQWATPHINGNVADVEPGAKTPADAAAGAREHVQRGASPTIYCPAGMLSECIAAVHAAGLEPGHIVAVQWASPTTNPDTQIPGTRLTLSQANADLSVTRRDWFPTVHRRPPIRKPKPPHPKVAGATAGALLGVALNAILHGAGIIHLTPVEASAISTLAAAIAGTVTPARKK